MSDGTTTKARYGEVKITHDTKRVSIRVWDESVPEGATAELEPDQALEIAAALWEHSRAILPPASIPVKSEPWRLNGACCTPSGCTPTDPPVGAEWPAGSAPGC